MEWPEKLREQDRRGATRVGFVDLGGERAGALKWKRRWLPDRKVDGFMKLERAGLRGSSG